MNGGDPMAGESRPRKKRIWLRRAARLAGLLAILAVAGCLFWLRGALYRRYVRFPREEAAWQAIRAQRRRVADNAGWAEFRGILHNHSYLSHDSKVSFPDILKALNAANLDFICLSDHPIQGRADFSLQWRGVHKGKLFIPGFEMRDGIMPIGVAYGVVLSNQTETATLARQIIENGGVFFYAHPEEPREWEQPELTGMEIYNLHSDFKRQRGGLGGLLPDLLLNLQLYPDHLYARLFRRPTEFLRRWDDLNRARHITGIAGNDSHQNVGWRAFYTANGRIRVQDTSPRLLKEYKLGWFTRPLARLLFGPLKRGRELFHVQLDPYERSARFVNTHVLARELSEPAVLEALRAGRVFIGFDMLADSSGFRWCARDEAGTAVMGESMAYSSRLHLRAMSPLPCRFTIIKDGAQVHQAEGRALDWTPREPGKYRVEAELRVLDEWVPWVYANPIQLK